MDIINTLINLRDDLKEWSTNNMLVLKSLIPTKTSELTNDNGFITSIPSEYVTETELETKNYATEEYVNNAVNTISSYGTCSTATETAIDLVTVTGDYVYLTRIGSGYDRKYNRLTKEVTIDYDSAFDPSVSEDEEETPIKETWTKTLSDVGYNDNTRYSTSPNTVLTTKTQAGIVALEPIFVTKGDVIRIKGFTYPSEAGKYSYLLVADTNKTNMGSRDIYYDEPSDAQLFNFSLDNDLLTINITDSSVAYVAICTPVYSADLSKVIVTMNTDISST